MRVLLGTTNPSKVKRFSDLLKGYDIEFITLRDIEVIEEPKEMGNTPCLLYTSDAADEL